MLLAALLACEPIPSETPETAPYFGGDSGAPETDTDTDDTGDTGFATTVPVYFVLSLDDEVETIVHARWTLGEAGKQSWVEYSFDDGEWLSTPPQSGAVGEHEDILLGIPADIDVDVRLVVESDEPRVVEEASITTGELPPELPEPVLIEWDETRALGANWILLTFDNGSNTFQGPYWVEIIDRRGRVVWYHEVPDGLTAFYNGVARDGTHLWFDAGTFFDPSGDARFIRMTLDGRYQEVIDAPNYHLGVDELADGSFVYEALEGGVYSINIGDGVDERVVWNCSEFMAKLGVGNEQCEANTVVWDPDRNTVFYSMFVSNSVVEIDLVDGAVLKQFGQLTGGDPWTIDPPEAVVDYQHYVNWTPDGTILASTHLVEEGGVQAANEYAVDEETKTLTLIWQYKTNDRYAQHTGEAYRLENGNTFIGYGTDGALRELADKDVVWEVEWPLNDAGTRQLGHAQPVANLYDLNRGP
jgi:hypothetical protein